MNPLVGVTLAVLAVGVLTYALHYHQLGPALLAVLGTLLGLAVALPKCLISRAPLDAAPPRPGRLSEAGTGGAPLLGELLVHRYGVITERQLAAALVGQSGTTKRLGEVLREMGLIDARVLETALAYQRTYRDPWRGGPWRDARR